MKFVERPAAFVVHVVLEVSEERFDRRVVDAISTSRHGLNHVQTFDLLDVQRIGVMEALVGMDERVLEHSRSENRIGLHGLHGVEYQTHLQMHGEVPGHDLAAREILHDGQIGEPVIEREVRDVGGKYLERRRDVEGAVQCVLTRSMFQRFFHDRFVRVAPADLGDEMILVLNASNLLVVHDDPFFQEFHLNRPPTVLRLPSTEDLTDLHVIIVVFVRLVRLFQPCVVAASGYVSNLAKQFDP